MAAKGIRTDIQALRGIAVLLVLLHHANIHLRAGYLGVDVFFVISGFLITTLVKNAIERGDFSFADFYFRRAKRLLPAAYTTFLVTGVGCAVLLTDSELHDFLKQLAGAVTFTGNVALWQQVGYFDGNAELKPLLHVWSLAIEEQYYLLLPAALVFTPRKLWRPGAALVIFGSLALCLMRAPSHPSSTFYLLPTRAWELGIGTIGALGLGKLRTVLAALYYPSLAAVFLVPFFPFGGAHPGVDAILVCVATLSIILRNHERIGNSAAAKGLAWFGDFSYSLYLVHWPVISLASNAWIGELPGGVKVGLVALAVVLARILFVYVEEPARHSKFVLSRRFVAVAVAASAFVVAVPWVAYRARGDAGYTAMRRANRGLSDNCAFEGRFSPLKECRTSESPRIMVWGDSNAMHIVAGIAATGRQLGLVQATRSNCGPFVDAAPVSRDPQSVNNRAWAQSCLDFNRSVLDYLAKSSVEVVVLSSSLKQYVDGSKWQLLTASGAIEDASVNATLAHLHHSAEAVRKLGKRVIVVAPPPSARFDIAACLERKASGRWTAGPHADCALSVATYHEERHDVLELLARAPRDAGVGVVSFDGVLCGSDVCTTSFDRTFVYRDGGHLSYAGSVLLANRVGLAPRLFADAN